ncbi:hypothetical protein F4778DRAFT_309108 [Xylariomycetidae sp. FL2044]|nr:hypothetical protein F4778DRAFT_309108 [Xylariomycetidae sp. FL2044]
MKCNIFLLLAGYVAAALGKDETCTEDSNASSTVAAATSVQPSWPYTTISLTTTVVDPFQHILTVTEVYQSILYTTSIPSDAELGDKPTKLTRRDAGDDAPITVSTTVWFTVTTSVSPPRPTVIVTISKPTTLTLTRSDVNSQGGHNTTTTTTTTTTRGPTGTAPSLTYPTSLSTTTTISVNLPGQPPHWTNTTTTASQPPTSGTGNASAPLTITPSGTAPIGTGSSPTWVVPTFTEWNTTTTVPFHSHTPEFPGHQISPVETTMTVEDSSALPTYGSGPRHENARLVREERVVQGHSTLVTVKRGA